MNIHTSRITTSESAPVYFSVSKQKLIVLSLCSLGLYEVYWFYKNWGLVRHRTGQEISPFWRAIFAPLFCYSLFKSVKQSADSHGNPSEISPGWLAFAYIAITITWRLPDPVWLVSLFTFLPLLAVQGVINSINLKNAPTADLNDHYTGKNIVVIVFGGLLLILGVLGTVVPE